ncbi:unnamed protein product [Owenia fusiformis]|uniref:C2H2-type domain-containing protein n=1 Tax=Owenia fusiformis TaxID=6347 RepID=A0A8S4N099_OWEFU|nr:unnamed protein product [Owenia fusiformis]
MARSRSRSRRRREQSRDRKAHHKHAEEKKSEHVSRKDEPTRRRVVIEKPPSRDRSPKRQEREKPPNRDRSPKRQERKLGVHPFGKMIAATKNYVKSEIKAVASSKGDSKKKRLDTHKSPDSHVKRSDQTLSSSHHKTGTSGSTGFSTKSTSGTDHRDGLDSSHNFQERMTSAVNLISSISCPTAESAKVGPETDTSHVCSLCAQVFTRKFNLQRHMRHLHGIDTTSLGEEPKVPFFPLTPNLEEEVDDSPVEQDHETPTSEADGESGDGKASTREHKDGLAEDHYSSDTDQDGRQEREVEGESPPITLDIPEENKSEPKGKETSTKSQASVPSATARSPEVRTIGTQTHGPSFAPNVYVHVDQVYF